MRIELLELRKELIVATDFAEELTEEEKKQVEDAKKQFEDGYAKLSEEDRNWLDNQLNEWLEIYLNDCKKKDRHL